ncbi:MAG TPA: hypothetical protein PK544_13115 [Spirochaetota bacterium]|nr:hypothetical protein [Spirochaetota bacterium]HPJ39230.1 hypothetical protein [Spirochaetota bacterium]
MMQQDDNRNSNNAVMKVRRTGFFFLVSGCVTLVSQIYYFNWDVTPDRKIWTIAWIGTALLFIFSGVSLMRKRQG